MYNVQKELIMKKIYYKIKENPKTQKVLQHKKFQKYEKLILLVGWAGFIYFLSSQQLDFIPVIDGWEFLLRKIAHVFVFAVLTFFMFRVLKFTEKRHVFWDLGWAFTFAILYAISDEYHQTLVPGRFGTVKDVIIDTIGVVIASWLIYLHYHYEKIRKLKYGQQKNSAK